MNLNDEINEQGETGLYSVETVNEIEKQMQEISGMGLMFYYGHNKIVKDPKISNEVLYKPHLLLNMILGLQNLQVKGTMVLKIHEIETQFTIGALFILYSLFESVLIMRPFSLSPLSSSQFISCKNLKNIQHARQIRDKLLVVYQDYLENPHKDMGDLLDYSIIETEDSLRQYLRGIYNIPFIESRTQILKAANANLDQINSKKEQNLMKMDNVKAFEKKMKLLQRWQIPVLNKVEPIHERFGSNKPYESKFVVNQTTEYIKQQAAQASSILADLVDSDEERERRKKRKRERHEQ